MEAAPSLTDPEAYEVAVPDAVLDDLDVAGQQAIRVLDVTDLLEGDGLVLVDRGPRPVDDDPVVVHCRSGSRSADAVEILREHGFSQAVNLAGGVLAWSDEIDSSMKKY
jgi:rhodanese-related sulfurtransferase